MQGFAKVAKPLTDLTKKGDKFVWNENCELAFEQLKKALTTSPVLAYPSREDPFILDTDSSNVAVGACLSQLVNGEERVIAYFSQALSSAEQQYCTTRKELLAVVKAAKRFRPYLLGRPVRVRTDNSAVRWMFNLHEPEGQVARWLEYLESYDLILEHRPGRVHNNADSLSRRPCPQCERIEAKSNKNMQENGNILGNTPWQPGEAGTSSDISCAAITRGQTHAQSDQHQAWLEGWDPVA